MVVGLVGFVGIVLPVVFRVVVVLDVVPFVGLVGIVLPVVFRVVVVLDVVPFVGFVGIVLPRVVVGFDEDVFKVLVVKEVSVVGPQVQAVVGFRVV